MFDNIRNTFRRVKGSCGGVFDNIRNTFWRVKGSCGGVFDNVRNTFRRVKGSCRRMFDNVTNTLWRMKGGAAVFLVIFVVLVLLDLWLATDDFYRKYVIPSVLSLGIAAVVWWRTDVTLRVRGVQQTVRSARSWRNAIRTVPVAVFALSFAESWVSAAIKHASTLYMAGLAQQSMLLVVLVATVITFGTSAYLVWVLPSDTVIRDEDPKS